MDTWSNWSNRRTPELIDVGQLGGESGSGPTMLAAISNAKNANVLFRFPRSCNCPFTRQYFLCPRAAPEKSVNLHGWHVCTNYNCTVHNMLLLPDR